MIKTCFLENGSAHMSTHNNDCATIWFGILERARNLNNFERAAEAQERLRLLGVKVEFGPIHTSQQTEQDEARPAASREEAAI